MYSILIEKVKKKMFESPFPKLDLTTGQKKKLDLPRKNNLGHEVTQF